MASISFEQSLADLESIVLQLEKGELTLDQSLSQFETGIQLAKTCQNLLTQAEKKIAELNLDTPSEGNFNNE